VSPSAIVRSPFADRMRTKTSREFGRLVGEGLLGEPHEVPRPDRLLGHGLDLGPVNAGTDVLAYIDEACSIVSISSRSRGGTLTFAARLGSASISSADRTASVVMGSPSVSDPKSTTSSCRRNLIPSGPS
jgi:hypothetical protein